MLTIFFYFLTAFLFFIHFYILEIFKIFAFFLNLMKFLNFQKLSQFIYFFQILRMLKHEHWMQKHTDVNTGKMLITFITRPGLPGEEKLLRPDPFLAPPEMEQVPILQEISGEQQQSRQNMEQQVENWENEKLHFLPKQQFQQQQAVQQRIHQQQQQQQSAMEQQYKVKFVKMIKIEIL